MPMDEDAMFKALLKNKPQQKQPVAGAGERKEETAKPPERPPAIKGSEDAMYRALLHNRPQAPKPLVKSEPVQPAQTAQVQQEPIQIEQAPREIDLKPVLDAINDLTASANQIQNLLKTMVLPVLVLILIVGIVILIKA